MVQWNTCVGFAHQPSQCYKSAHKTIADLHWLLIFTNFQFLFSVRKNGQPKRGKNSGTVIKIFFCCNCAIVKRARCFGPTLWRLTARTPWLWSPWAAWLVFFKWELWGFSSQICIPLIHMYLCLPSYYPPFTGKWELRENFNKLSLFDSHGMI